MWKIITSLLATTACAAFALSLAFAQPPERKDDKAKGKDKAKSSSSLVDRMMAFDKNKDGKLTKEEVTDERLHRLFDMADANKDGVVTREELVALAAKLDEQGGTGGRGGKGKGGPGGPGGKDDDGPGGPGGRGGPGGPGGRFRPGQILPPFVADRLELTPAQVKEVAALQKEVDAKLAKILTAEQKKQFDEGPGGPGGPGGRGPGGKGKGNDGPPKD
jgi:hypothetical protein